MAKGYTAFVLPEAERARLLGIYPTMFKNVVAHHVTDEFGVSGPRVDFDEGQFFVVGQVCEDGVQALVVDHYLDCGLIESYRSDGKRYHITWSLAPNRRPVDSNRVILDYGFSPPLHQVKFKADYTFIPF